MKKVLILCLILSFFLVLVGCDEKKNNSTSNEHKVEENEEVNFYTDYDLVSNGTTASSHHAILTTSMNAL